MEGQTKSIEGVELDSTDLHNYLKARLYPPYLPINLTEDWSIFGSVITHVYGPNGIFPKEYTDDEVRKWLEHRLKVKSLLKYCQWKIFNDYAMLKNKRDTDAVLMRIIVSKLNNFGLPKVYEDEIFDNVHLQYQIRKSVFEDYFVIKVLGLPFGLTTNKVCPF